MSHDNNWFERARTYNLPSFLEQRYHMEISKSNKCLCPFHDDTKPTLSLKEKGGEWIFKCFSCDAGGDITKFVEMHDKVSALDAVKTVLTHFGENIEEGNKKELTPEEIAEIEQRKQSAADRKAAKAKEDEKQKKTARTEMAKAAPVYAENLYEAYQNGNQNIVSVVESKFPNIYSNTEIRDLYLGWDYDNESLCIINRDLSGNVFNIKAEHRKGIHEGWRFGANFSTFDFPGKWISWKDASTRVFGLEFMDREDERIVLCEGEKDAINLMLLGINALTLGGVTSSWEEHKEVLKDKQVFIWFDHDAAGYLNVVKRYKEIREIAKSTQAILFFKLGDFPKKYDISDYLQDKNVINKSQLFDLTVYSSFTVTNQILHEIYEYIESDLKENEKESFLALKDPEVVKEFSECKADITKAVKDIRGEKDEEVKLMNHLSKQLSSSHLKDDMQKLINSLFPENSEYIGAELSHLKKIVEFKKTMMTSYRQTHVYDMVKELMRATESTGYSFAKYREGLYFWTGNYFYTLRDWEIKDYILQEFMRAGKIDFKKQTVKTRDEILSNVYGWADSLEAYIEKDKRVINVTNGALIIRASGKCIFRDHHRKHDCAMNMLPFAYDVEARAPKWKAFLNRVLPDADDQNALMEFMGYCFLPSHMYEKFLLLYGSTGANGKSVVLEVIRDFFSKENVSSLELHRFEGHELDALKNKILNVGSEIESGGDMRKQFAALKNITATKDTLTINPKNEKPYELYPEEKPKMAFATNKLIKSGADDGGVLRRMLLLHFNQEIKDDEKIRDLTERFKDEKSGILNMALEGLGRLIKQNGFSMSEGRAVFMDEYRSDINPVRAYAKECIGQDEGVMIAKKFVYEHYKKWCEERGVTAWADRTFWSKFKEQHDFKEVRLQEGKYISGEHDKNKLAARPQFIRGFKFIGDVMPKFRIGEDEIDVRENNISVTGYYPVVLEEA